MEQDEATQQKLNAWFQVLHRLARIHEDDKGAPALTPQPLNAVVAELVGAGLVQVLDTPRPDSQVRLNLTPEGWDQYDLLCADLARQGWPIQGWVPGRHRQSQQANA